MGDGVVQCCVMPRNVPCCVFDLPPHMQGLEALATARAANVKMAFGSDLLGAMHK